MSDTWERRFAERRAQFIRKAVEKLRCLLRQLERFEKEEKPAELLLQINRQFHQFAGSGGIYELMEFCRHSIAGEEICSRLIQAKRLPEPNDLALLKNAATAMLAAANNEPAPLMAYASAYASTAELAKVGEGGEGIVSGRILYLEDDAEQAGYVSCILGERGYKVVHVQAVGEFKRSFAESVPDLVLLDIMLGERPAGVEMVAYLREHSDCAAMPIVILTSLTEAAVQEQCLLYGADEYLTKPVTAGHLLAVISGRLPGSVYNAEDKMRG